MNSNIKRLLPLVAAMLCPLAVLPAAELRQSINANREWRFQPGDVANADATVFDDSSWSAANLPHSFSMPCFAADRFYVGYGWYRKHFEAPAAWSGNCDEAALSGKWIARDLWQHKNLGIFDTKLSLQVPAHGAVLLKLSQGF